MAEAPEEGHEYAAGKDAQEVGFGLVGDGLVECDTGAEKEKAEEEGLGISHYCRTLYFQYVSELIFQFFRPHAEVPHHIDHHFAVVGVVGLVEGVDLSDEGEGGVCEGVSLGFFFTIELVIDFLIQDRVGFIEVDIL